ncbi:unnamed protein product, partial [Discosporangium mesarthrocarpum]
EEEAAILALNQQAGSMRQGFGNRTWTAEGGSGSSNRTMGFGPGRGRGGPGGMGGPGGRGPHGSGRGMMDRGTQGGGRDGGRGWGRGGMMGGSHSHSHVSPRGFFGGRGGGVPPGYVCRRCNQPGHHIKDCPTNGDASYDNAGRKLVKGIPTSMIQLADAASRGGGGGGGGGLVNSSGQLVVIRSNEQAFHKLKEYGGGQSVEGLLERLSKEAPAHLKCAICNKIMSDAVINPCCHKSTCDSCARSALATGNMMCPLCNTKGKGPDGLVPNESTRAAVEAYLTMVTQERRGKAEKERVAERFREDQERAKREADAAAVAAAAASGGGSGAGLKGPLSVGGGKRKQPHQHNKGVDAILRLGPRGAEDEEEEGEEDGMDAEDPFGHDVYEVDSNAPLERQSSGGSLFTDHPEGEGGEGGEGRGEGWGERGDGAGGMDHYGRGRAGNVEGGLGSEAGPGAGGGGGRGRGMD